MFVPAQPATRGNYKKSERDEEEKNGARQPGPTCLQKSPHPVWFSELLFV
jgi:hypothetical protein